MRLIIHFADNARVEIEVSRCLWDMRTGVYTYYTEKGRIHLSLLNPNIRYIETTGEPEKPPPTPTPSFGAL